jgi:hypothetical protein
MDFREIVRCCSVILLRVSEASAVVPREASCAVDFEGLTVTFPALWVIAFNQRSVLKEFEAKSAAMFAPILAEAF